MITITEIEANRLVDILELFDDLVRSQEQCPYCYKHTRTERHENSCISKWSRELHDQIQYMTIKANERKE